MKTFADMPEFFGGRQEYNKRLGSQKLTTEQIGREWIKRFGPDCPECGLRMVAYNHPFYRQSRQNAITIDHIVARGLGGTNAMTNQRCICNSCNHIKSLEENRLCDELSTNPPEEQPLQPPIDTDPAETPEREPAEHELPEDFVR